jgi:hypothetical protein
MIYPAPDTCFGKSAKNYMCGHFVWWRVGEMEGGFLVLLQKILDF